MTEERKDQEHPEAENTDEGSPTDEPRMENVTPPDAQAASEEVAARERLEAEAEQAEAEPASAEVPDEGGEADQAPAAERAVTEDVADAGESLTEDTPPAIADEAVSAVGQEASKAEQPTDETGAPAQETAGTGAPPAPDDEAQAPPEADEAQPSVASEDQPASEDDDRSIGEDVGAGADTVAEAPADWTEAAVSAVGHEAAKAEGDVDESGAPEEGIPESAEAQDEDSAERQAPTEAGLVAPAPAVPSQTGAPRPPRQPRPSRRTTAREARRHRSHARRSRRQLIIGVLGGAVAAMLILGLVIGDFGLTPQPTDPGTAPRVGTETTIQSGGIIAPGAEHAGYEHTPPTSGPRYEEPAPWGVYDERQEDEAVVRNLQVGGVVFNHNLTSQEAVNDLRSFVEGLPGYPACYVMHPYPEVPEGAVVLTSWGWTQQLNGVDRTGMADFVNDHRNQGDEFLNTNCGVVPPEAEATPAAEEPTPAPEETPAADETPAPEATPVPDDESAAQGEGQEDAIGPEDGAEPGAG
ncbi:MAG: DUF3105 domain-containing protein [Dehalococcoidia bacterium]